MWGIAPNKQVYGLKPSIKIVSSDIITPSKSPISIETKTTVRNVTNQTAASILLNFQKLKNAVICISMPFNATTITLANTACKKKL